MAGAAGFLPGFPFVARARAADQPLSGTTLNVSCWSATYPKLSCRLHSRSSRSETGIKVNYDTPAFPIYNQRVDLELSTGQRLRRSQRHLHLHEPLDRGWLARAARRLHQGPEQDARRLGRRFSRRHHGIDEGQERSALRHSLDLRRDDVRRGARDLFRRPVRHARHVRRGDKAMQVVNKKEGVAGFSSRTTGAGPSFPSCRASAATSSAIRPTI